MHKLQGCTLYFSSRADICIFYCNGSCYVDTRNSYVGHTFQIAILMLYFIQRSPQGTSTKGALDKGNILL
jgi:hypothetical protein